MNCVYKWESWYTCPIDTWVDNPDTGIKDKVVVGGWGAPQLVVLPDCGDTAASDWVLDPEDNRRATCVTTQFTCTDAYTSTDSDTKSCFALLSTDPAPPDGEPDKRIITVPDKPTLAEPANLCPYCQLHWTSIWDCVTNDWGDATLDTVRTSCSRSDCTAVDWAIDPDHPDHAIKTTCGLACSTSPCNLNSIKPLVSGDAGFDSAHPEKAGSIPDKPTLTKPAHSCLCSFLWYSGWDCQNKVWSDPRLYSVIGFTGVKCGSCVETEWYKPEEMPGVLIYDNWVMKFCSLFKYTCGDVCVGDGDCTPPSPPAAPTNNVWRECCPGTIVPVLESDKHCCMCIPCPDAPTAVYIEFDVAYTCANVSCGRGTFPPPYFPCNECAGFINTHMKLGPFQKQSACGWLNGAGEGVYYDSASNKSTVLIRDSIYGGNCPSFAGSSCSVQKDGCPIGDYSGSIILGYAPVCSWIEDVHDPDTGEVTSSTEYCYNEHITATLTNIKVTS